MKSCIYSFMGTLKLRGCVTEAGTDKPVPEDQINWWLADSLFPRFNHTIQNHQPELSHVQRDSYEPGIAQETVYA